MVPLRLFLNGSFKEQVRAMTSSVYSRTRFRASNSLGSKPVTVEGSISMKAYRV